MSAPAYLILQTEIEDFGQYLERYTRPVVAQLSELGAELLVTTAEAQALEGEWPGNWTVVIRFPDWDTAVNWYGSEAYAALKHTRRTELSGGGNMVLLPGRDEEGGG
jgi:uncharacterized protein (DUF1330 family)